MAKREYAKVAPEFWTGVTGREIRAHSRGRDGILIALYLMTNPHANAIGLYYLPLPYAMQDTGLSAEEIGDAFATLAEVGFIERDKARDLVWVVEMGKYQVGPTLAVRDHKRKWVAKMTAPYAASPLARKLAEHYPGWGLALPSEAPSKGSTRGFEGASQARGFEGASKPLRRGASMEMEMESERERERERECEGEGGIAGPAAVLRTAAPSGLGVDEPTPALRATTFEPPLSRPKPAAVMPQNTAPLTEAPVAPSEPAPKQRPAVHAGAAARRIARLEAHEAARSPESGAAVAWHTEGGRVRAACLFGRGRSQAPGPWVPSAEVYDATAVRLDYPIPNYVHPDPPKLPEGDDAERAEAMLIAWRAVHENKTGRSYKGAVGKRAKSIAEAARMLGPTSAWVWFDWAWDHEQERTGMPPKFYTLASPKFVGRLIDRCQRTAARYRGVVASSEKRRELAERRQSALLDLYRERPSTPEQASAIVDRYLPTEVYDSLVADVLAEATRSRKRDELALARGHWIWSRPKHDNDNPPPATRNR
jgi:hypothetical protein